MLAPIDRARIWQKPVVDVQNCQLYKTGQKIQKEIKNIEIQSTKIQNCSNFGGIGQQQLLLVYRTVKCTKPVPPLQWPACAQLTAIARKDLPSQVHKILWKNAQKVKRRRKISKLRAENEKSLSMMLEKSDNIKTLYGIAKNYFYKLAALQSLHWNCILDNCISCPPCTTCPSNLISTFSYTVKTGK